MLIVGLGNKRQTATGAYRAATTLTRLDATYKAGVMGRGGRGLDRLSVDRFDHRRQGEFAIIRRKARNYTYSFTPYLESLIPKGRGQVPRLISLPTVRDRVMLASLKDVLHAVFPEAVHRTLPNAHVRAVKQFLGAGHGATHFMRADIRGFYDNVDHQVLEGLLRTRIRSDGIRGLMMRAVKNPTVPSRYRRQHKHRYVLKKGIPQGLAISNVLANLYLKRIDIAIKREVPLYHRYVDDILMLGSQQEVAAAKAQLENRLSEVGLVLNQEKCYDGPISDRFEFLGYAFDGLRVSVRASTVDRFISSLAGRFTRLREEWEQNAAVRKWLTPGGHRSVFIEELNLATTGAISGRRRYGWLFYFLEITDRALLHQLDAIVTEFFERSPRFASRPAEAKRFARAYFEAKHRPGSGYLVNYDNVISLPDKVNYLRRFGLLNPGTQYSADELDELYEAAKTRHLHQLELDLSRMS